MQIKCPWCGPRDQSEFTCGGEAHIQRPKDPAGQDDRAWADYLFARQNPAGRHHERWLHQPGCGQWFHLTRDTRTHKIERVYKMDELPEDAA